MFPAIVLPEPAYRRSYFARLLERRANIFAELLAQLAPDRYAAMGDAYPMDYYWVLLEHCSTLFPVFEPGFDFYEEMGEEEEGYDPLAEADYQGIPVQVLGVDSWDASYGTSPALCLCEWWGLEQARRNRQETPRALRPYFELLAGYAASPIVPGCRCPPEGRVWREPWSAIGDLLDYFAHNTGWRFLDYSREMLDWNQMPPWNIEEINDLAQDWARTQPVWERIKKLWEYIDDKHYRTERLPLLAGLLVGDSKARRTLSRPQRREAPGKTLIDVLCGVESV